MIENHMGQAPDLLLAFRQRNPVYEIMKQRFGILHGLTIFAILQQ
jgi:hypothetical protein